MEVSESIKLQLLIEKDAEKFYNLIDKNKEYLKEFMPRMLETKSVGDTRDVIKIFLNQIIENNGFRAAIYYNLDMVGIVGFKYMDWQNMKTEMMYWIDQDYTGKGIATECVEKLINVAFYEYGMNKIIIKSSVKNIGSKKIAEKCGFTIEGTLKEDELLMDGFTDINVYSLLKKDHKEGE